MNLDELRPILQAYRQQVEPAWSRATAHEGYDGKTGDPAGQCGVTSAWAQRRLREDHGIETLYTKGAVFAPHVKVPEHCWLETGPRDLVIDLTADQITGLPSVVCATYEELFYEGGIGYRPEWYLIGPALTNDPVQPRLAILDAAVTR